MFFLHSNASKAGSFRTSLQTPFMTSADTSLISLYRNVTNPHFLQEIECFGLQFDPYIHRADEFGST